MLKETAAIQAAFREKRAKLLSRLEELGVRIDRPPDGTFYVWGSVKGLPPPLDDGMGFFRAALEKKVIAVPGEFFDVNPANAGIVALPASADYVRFSFGPPAAAIDQALTRFAEMISEAQSRA